MRAFFAAVLVFLAGIFGAHHPPVQSVSQNSEMAAVVLARATTSPVASPDTPTTSVASTGAQSTNQIAPILPAATTLAAVSAPATTALTVSTSGVSEDELAQKLNALENKLTSLIYSGPAARRHPCRTRSRAVECGILSPGVKKSINSPARNSPTSPSLASRASPRPTFPIFRAVIFQHRAGHSAEDSWPLGPRPSVMVHKQEG